MANRLFNCCYSGLSGHGCNWSHYVCFLYAKETGSGSFEGGNEGKESELCFKFGNDFV